MTKRWPNADIWQRFEKTFRTTAGSRWRTAAAIKFRVKRSDLRRLIDREDFQNVDLFDKALIDHLHKHADGLRQRAEDACNVAREVMRARDEVSPHYLIEVPVKLDPVPRDDWRTSEPQTAWERLVQTTFADILEDA